MLRFCLAPSVSVLLVAHSVPRPPGRDAPTANSSGARAAARARRPGLRRESRAERATPAEHRTVCSARCPRARIVHVSADCSQSHTVLCVSALGAGSMGQRQTTPRPERSETRHVHAHVQVDVTETLSRPRAKRSRPTPAPVFRSEVRAFLCSRAPHGKIPSFPMNSMKSRATRSMYCSQIPLTGRRWPRLRQLLPCRRALGPSAALLPSP